MFDELLANAKNRFPAGPWVALSVLSVLLGSAVIAWSWSEERRLQSGLTGILQAHVQSVVRLVSEGARQAALATDATAEMQEAQLDTVTGLLGSPGLPPADAVRSADLALRVRLRESLLRLREGSGLGPLLREVASAPIVYVAIQDQEGLLAASRGAGPLSSWAEDPDLARAENGQLSFREIPRSSRVLVEGLSPFALPDGTTAVLRIGMDARPTRALLESAQRRHRLLVVVVGLLIGITGLVAWAMRRRDLRLASVERLAELHRQQQHHWQALGQLAAEVAHEVRNPLNTVRMVAQRLAREFVVSEPDRAEYSDLVAMLSQESDRVGGVVSEFLDLSRPLELRLEELELGELLQEALPAMRMRAESEGKQLFLAPAPPLRIRADRRRLHQVVVNLVSNALDAVPRGGQVELRIASGAHGAELRIEDDGAGMTPQMLEQAGRPFVTSKPKGTGLGLALTKRLIEAHGGSLALESEPGKGTVAIVRLPSIPKLAQGEAEDAPTAQELSHGS
jgi:signal transduction histidine kinase